jgi:hypothetical protein
MSWIRSDATQYFYCNNIEQNKSFSPQKANRSRKYFGSRLPVLPTYSKRCFQTLSEKSGNSSQLPIGVSSSSENMVHSYTQNTQSNQNDQSKSHESNTMAVVTMAPSRVSHASVAPSTQSTIGSWFSWVGSIFDILDVEEENEDDTNHKDKVKKEEMVFSSLTSIHTSQTHNGSNNLASNANTHANVNENIDYRNKQLPNHDSSFLGSYEHVGSNFLSGNLIGDHLSRTVSNSKLTSYIKRYLQEPVPFSSSNKSEVVADSKSVSLRKKPEHFAITFANPNHSSDARNQSPISTLDLERAEHHVLDLTISTSCSVYPGQQLIGWIDFSRSTVSCFRISVCLEREEILQKAYGLANTSMRSQAAYVSTASKAIQNTWTSSDLSGLLTSKTVLWSKNIITSNTQKTGFVCPIPVDAVHSFQSEMIQVRYFLKFKFIIDPNTKLHPLYHVYPPLQENISNEDISISEEFDDWDFTGNEVVSHQLNVNGVTDQRSSASSTKSNKTIQAPPKQQAGWLSWLSPSNALSRTSSGISNIVRAIRGLNGARPELHANCLKWSCKVNVLPQLHSNNPTFDIDDDAEDELFEFDSDVDVAADHHVFQACNNSDTLHGNVMSNQPVDENLQKNNDPYDHSNSKGDIDDTYVTTLALAKVKSLTEPSMVHENEEIVVEVEEVQFVEVDVNNYSIRSSHKRPSKNKASSKKRTSASLAQQKSAENSETIIHDDALATYYGNSSVQTTPVLSPKSNDSVLLQHEENVCMQPHTSFAYANTFLETYFDKMSKINCIAHTFHL